jgi:hypothetical protein
MQEVARSGTAGLGDEEHPPPAGWSPELLEVLTEIRAETRRLATG